MITLVGAIEDKTYPQPTSPVGFFSWSQMYPTCGGGRQGLPTFLFVIRSITFRLTGAVLLYR